MNGIIQNNEKQILLNILLKTCKDHKELILKVTQYLFINFKYKLNLCPKRRYYVEKCLHIFLYDAQKINGKLF